MDWTGDVGDEDCIQNFCLDILGNMHLGDKEVDGRIKLRWLLEK
jgi:hypothetical protein